MAKELRMGVIGVGSMGSFHAGYLKQGKIPRARLAAVCDVRPSQLEGWGDARRYEDSAKLLRSGEVDAVIIATPHYFHTTIGIDAFQHGIHVLSEKPVSVHKADCQRMIKAHKANPKTVFGAMFQMRTEPHFRKVRQLVRGGELGTVRRVSWVVTNWFRSQAYYSSGGWRATWKGEGGGVLMNQCPHNIDIMQWVVGMPSRVHGHCYFGKYHDIEVEDEANAYMEYPNGATGTFLTTTGEAPGTNRWEIAGDMGKIVVEDGRISFTRNEVSARKFSLTTREFFDGPPTWEIAVPVSGSGGGHAGITRNFVDSVLDGTPLIAPGEEGIHSVEFANAIILSSLTGRPVDLPMNGAVYEAKLKGLARKSRFIKKGMGGKGRPADISGSFK